MVCDECVLHFTSITVMNSTYKKYISKISINDLM